MIWTRGGLLNILLAAAFAASASVSGNAAGAPAAEAALHAAPSLSGEARMTWLHGLIRRVDAELREYAEKIRSQPDIVEPLARRYAEAAEAYNAEISRAAAVIRNALNAAEAPERPSGKRAGVHISK